MPRLRRRNLVNTQHKHLKTIKKHPAYVTITNLIIPRVSLDSVHGDLCLGPDSLRNFVRMRKSDPRPVWREGWC